MKRLVFTFATLSIFTLILPTTVLARDTNPSIMKVELRSKTAFDGKDMDVAYTQLRLAVGTKEITFKEYLDEYARKGDTDIDQVWDFTIGLSAVPFVVKDLAQTKADEKIDEKIADYQEKAELQIPVLRSQALTKFLMQNPALAQAYSNGNPTAIATVAAVQAQIEDTIRNTIEQKFSEAKRAAKDKVSDRLKDLEMETAVQEVAIRYAKKGKHFLSYLQLGKIAINGAGETNEQNETAIEKLRPINDEVVRILGAANTTGANFGIISTYNLNNGEKLTLKADLYVFHERNAFISGNDYVGRVITMSDRDYEQHKDLLDINATLLRIMASQGKWSAYISGAASKEHHKWAGAGLTYAFTKKLNFILNAYVGNRDEAKSALSTYLAYEINPRTSIYTGLVLTRGAHTPHLFEGTYDKNEVVAGINYQMPSMLWGFFTQPRVSLEAFANERTYDSAIDRQHQDRFDFGGRIGFTSMAESAVSLEDLREKKSSLQYDLQKAQSRGKDATKIQFKLNEVDQKIKIILNTRIKAAKVAADQAKKR